MKKAWSIPLRIVVYSALIVAVWTVYPIFKQYPEKAGGVVRAEKSSDPALKKKTATVLELFTSQSCYSCPPAEAYLRQLAPRPDIMALEFHVDYWNDLHYGPFGTWKDVLSFPGATQRQSKYDEILMHSATVFTPQLVIDGHYQAVGSKKEKITQLIAKAKKTRPGHLTIQAAMDNKGRLTVTPSGPLPKEADYIFLRLIKRDVTKVRAGENKGKTLASYNIVTSLKDMGQKPRLTGIKPLSDKETCAVLVQNPKTMQIYAGAFCRLP